MYILYICTHNRCRSIMAEAITNQQSQRLSNGIVVAKSAGSTPAGEVHPLTLMYLEQAGYSTEGLTSNSWDDQDYMDDFVPDVLITVCDNAAGEACPLWLGDIPKLQKLHWGLTDPSKDTEDKAATTENFRQTIQQIEQRVAKLIKIAALPESDRIKALQALTGLPN